MTPDPRTVSLSERGVFPPWSKAGLVNSPINPSHEEYPRAHYSVCRHKQVTSSHNLTLILQYIKKKAAEIVKLYRLFVGWGQMRPRCPSP